jgi:cyclophilin family peptidyl-prolyl cis-trans isomerase/HEAT repeat protein
MISSRRRVTRLQNLRIVVAMAAASLAASCATAPPVVQNVVTPEQRFEQTMADIIRLEDHRILRDPSVPPPAAPAPAPAPAPRGREAAPPPPPPPDLTRFLTDPEARIRRRAALAVGRVGLKEGAGALLPLLADTDPEVRQMAAFALGLIHDAGVRPQLEAALDDPSPLVQGSAAQALGMIGDAAAAPAIGRLVGRIVDSGVVTVPPSEDDEARRDTPAAAFRLGVDALARLGAFDPLAQVLLDSDGQPRVNWWPAASALARVANPRARGALLTLAKDPQPYTRAYAARGLGAVGGSPEVVQLLVGLLQAPERSVVIEAIRSLARIGDAAAVDPLVHLIEAPETDPQVRLEAVTAAGSFHGAAPLFNLLLDFLAHPNAAIRAAALRSVAAIDPEGFVTVLSGLDPDSQWTVRAALAEALGTLSPERGVPRLRQMLQDADQRVIPAVLGALVKLHPDGIEAIVLDHLKAEDPVVRGAAADAVGKLKPEAGPAALVEAFHRGAADATYVARASALAAISTYGLETARPLLEDALADKDWAVRVRAAQLLGGLDPSRADALQDAIRPAPTRLARDDYAAQALVNPPFSPQVYIETDRGRIQLELAVLDAPLTVENFSRLARAGFFNGLPVHRVVPDYVVQTGDPRGDSEGGPGYTVRDEINERPYLRGTVGMALDWADTGGSQFFITLSPQPQLDGRYTVFGRVVDGMSVVDALQPWDLIRAVQVWDGSGS